MKNFSSQFYSAEEAIEKVRTNNFIQICTVAFIKFLIGWSLLSGVVILFFRFLRLNAPFFYLFLYGIPLALIYGADYAYKHRASTEVCVASVDAHNNAGGLLISEYETGDKSWRIFRKATFIIPDIKTPDNFSQLIGILLLALIFVWGSFYVPILNLNRFGGKKINLSRKISEIKEQIELLQQEDIISTEEQAKLETALDDIVKNSDNESPGITFEALDQMAEKLRYEASDEMKKRIKDMETLRKLEKFAKEARKAAGNSQKINEELEKLKKQLRQAGLSESEINDLLNQQFGNSGNGSESRMSNKNLSNISQALNNNIQKKLIETSELAEKMMDKKLIDEKTGEKFKQSMESNSSDYSDSKNQDNNFFEVGSNSVKESDSSNNNSDKGNSSNQEGSQSNQEGSQSGQEGSQSGQEGSQSGQEGGQSGQEGGQSGQEGGQSGQEGGISGESGEESMMGFGDGGIGKGGGKTPMMFGDKTSDYNAKYHDEVLPSVNPGSAGGATSIGIGIADPEVSKEKEEYSSGDIKHIDNGENSLNKKNILPKHRNAVKNYFNQ